MAKKAARKTTKAVETVEKPPELPEGIPIEQEPTQRSVLPEPVTGVVSATSEVLTVSVPSLAGVEGYCRRRVDVSMTRSHAKKLKGMLQGLEQQDARLANGRFVSTPTHVVLWLIENCQ